MVCNAVIGDESWWWLSEGCWCWRYQLCVSACGLRAEFCLSCDTGRVAAVCAGAGAVAVAGCAVRLRVSTEVVLPDSQRSQ
eukprot:3603262-Rhodomonas_salina.1